MNLGIQEMLAVQVLDLFLQELMKLCPWKVGDGFLYVNGSQKSGNSVSTSKNHGNQKNNGQDFQVKVKAKTKTKSDGNNTVSLADFDSESMKDLLMTPQEAIDEFLQSCRKQSKLEDWMQGAGENRASNARLEKINREVSGGQGNQSSVIGTIRNPLVGVSKAKSRLQTEGFSPLRFSNLEGMEEGLLNDEETVQELVHGSKEKSGLSEWRTVTKSKGKGVKVGTVPLADVSNQSPNQVVDSSPIFSDNLLQLSKSDVEDEIAYWEMGVVAYVLGFNPHLKLFEGYSHRIWGKSNIDKVIPIKPGIFLIRFLNNDSRIKP
ncbi:Proteasome-associated ATPase [Bienertia sinuspersici]